METHIGHDGTPVTRPARVRLVQDDDVESPRRDDNVGTMIHWHRRQTVGDRGLDETEHSAMERGGFALLERYLRMRKGAVVVLPVAMLDHGGQHVWVGRGPHWSDAAGWDSGTVGAIYATREACDKNWGAGQWKPEDVVGLLRGEVETYDQWLSGDAWGFVVEDEDGEELDSCWGFYGDDPKTNGMWEHWGAGTRAVYERDGFAKEDR